MPFQISGTVTRKSNGSFEITPVGGVADKRLPDMGDEVTLDITITATVAEVEKRTAKPVVSASPDQAALSTTAATVDRRIRK